MIIKNYEFLPAKKFTSHFSKYIKTNINYETDWLKFVYSGPEVEEKDLNKK